jgi:hypothetical protein
MKDERELVMVSELMVVGARKVAQLHNVLLDWIALQKSIDRQRDIS